MAKIRKYGIFDRLADNGYDQQEEEKIYDSDLDMVYRNPMAVLDHLDKFATYRVSWFNYETNCPVLPLKHCKNRKLYK